MVKKGIEELEEKRIENYITKELKEGFSIEKIKRALIDAGHPKEIIEKVIKAVELKGREKVPLKEVKPEKIFKTRPRFLLIFLLVLIVIIGIIWFGINTGPVCGDGICELEEETCPEDCVVFVLTKEDIVEGLTLCKQDYKNLCLTVTNKDITYCNSIENEIVRVSCLTRAAFILDIFENKDINVCSEIKEVTYEECSNIIDSIKTRDITKCQSKLCESGFNFYLAISQENLALCEKIEDESMKTDCKLYLTSDMNHCDYSYCYDVYNIHMMEITGDLSYCDKVISPSGKQACLEYRKT